MFKLLRSDVLDLRAVVGIDPDSEGLALARRHGLVGTPDGVDWLIDHADEFELVFEATSAWVHRRHAPRYEEVGLRVVALIEVEGAADFFPPYAGNLDIMTAAATRVGEAMAERLQEVRA